MTIGEKIKHLRTLKGYSQESMADTLGISVTAYGNIERGGSDISYTRLEQIAKSFGMDVVSLLSHGDKFEHIFNCSNNNIISTNTLGNNSFIASEKELLLQIERLNSQAEKLQLQLEKANLEKEKAELEVRYLKEKVQN